MSVNLERGLQSWHCHSPSHVLWKHRISWLPKRNDCKQCRDIILTPGGTSCLRISGATTVSLLSSVTSSCLLTLMTASPSLNMSFITSRTFPRKFSGWSHSPTTSDILRFMVSHHRKINTHWAHAQPIPLNTVKQITIHGKTPRMLKTFDGIDPTERVGWTSPPLSNINM